VTLYTPGPNPAGAGADGMADGDAAPGGMVEQAARAASSSTVSFGIVFTGRLGEDGAGEGQACSVPPRTRLAPIRFLRPGILWTHAVDAAGRQRPAAIMTAQALGDATYVILDARG
jgi:hypothetical protein